MRIGLILVGFLFLANPVIHVLDVFPDAIGYLLLMAGISKPALFVEHLADAKKWFGRLALITLCRSLAVFIWPGSTDSTMLLLTFVFSLLEMACFIPAMLAFYDGLSFAALWYNGTAVFAKTEKIPKKKYADDPEPQPRVHEKGSAWRNLTIAFFLFRTIATLLPELTALQLYDNLGDVTLNALNYAEYKPLFYLVLGFFVVVAAIIWYIVTVRYFRGIRRDKPFLEALDRKFREDILPQKGIFYAQSMRIALVLLLLVSVSSLNLLFDGIDILVGAIPAFLLIGASCIVGKYIRLAYAAIPLALLRAGLSVWNLIAQIRFFDEYTYDMIEWIARAQSRYRTLTATMVIEQLLGLAAILCFLFVLAKAVRYHLQTTGEAMDTAQYSKKARDLETGNTISSRILLNAVLAIVQAIVAALYPYGILHISSMLIVEILVTLIWIAHTVYTVRTIDQLVYQPMRDNAHS